MLSHRPLIIPPFPYSNIDSLSANLLERGPIGGFVDRAFTFVYGGDIEGQNGCKNDLQH